MSQHSDHYTAIVLSDLIYDNWKEVHHGLGAMGFGLPPKMLQSTDTTQLLALAAAKRVLDEATLDRFKEADKERINVILGVVSPLSLAGHMWGKLQRPVWIKSLRESGIPEPEAQKICDRIAASYPEWTESTFPGAAFSAAFSQCAFIPE